jgi:hypothetical protein
LKHQDAYCLDKSEKKLFFSALEKSDGNNASYLPIILAGTEGPEITCGSSFL